MVIFPLALAWSKEMTEGRERRIAAWHHDARHDRCGKVPGLVNIQKSYGKSPFSMGKSTINGHFLWKITIEIVDFPMKNGEL